MILTLQHKIGNFPDLHRKSNIVPKQIVQISILTCTLIVLINSITSPAHGVKNLYFPAVWPDDFAPVVSRVKVGGHFMTIGSTRRSEGALDYAESTRLNKWVEKTLRYHETTVVREWIHDPACKYRPDRLDEDKPPIAVHYTVHFGDYLETERFVNLPHSRANSSWVIIPNKANLGAEVFEILVDYARCEDRKTESAQVAECQLM